MHTDLYLEVFYNTLRKYRQLHVTPLPTIASESLNFLKLCEDKTRQDVEPAASHTVSGFGGLGVSALAFSTQVRRFIPGRSRRIFKGEKILSTPSFGGKVKPSVPCRRFAACKRSLNVARKSIFRQSYRTFLATRGLWRCIDVWGGHLVTETGTSKLGGGPRVAQ